MVNLRETSRDGRTRRARECHVNLTRQLESRAIITRAKKKTFPRVLVFVAEKNDIMNLGRERKSYF